MANKILLSQPYTGKNGDLRRDFYVDGLGFGRISQSVNLTKGSLVTPENSIVQTALVNFNDLPEPEPFSAAIFFSDIDSTVAYKDDGRARSLILQGIKRALQ